MPTVLITGANRGLGLEFAKQYAEAGWTVIACCRDRGTADEIRNLAKANGGRVKVGRLDVLAHASIEAVAETYKGQPIDILINNAGEMGPKREDIGRQSFGGMEYDIWDRIMRTNVFGPMKVSEASTRASSTPRSVASSAASVRLSTRRARMRGFFSQAATASLFPAMMPACGPPSSLSPEKNTSPTPSEMLS